MIHYSVVPAEMCFQDPNQPVPDYRELMLDGVSMLVEVEGPFHARIVRLLSMNPQHYLDTRFQPGNRVPLPLPEH